MSKHEEKLEEKSPEEKWRRDPLGSVIWAVILIWIGLAIMTRNTRWRDAINGFLAQLRFQAAESPLEGAVDQLSVWSIIFLGAGLILLVEVAIRLLFTAYRRPVLGTLILAIILIGIGLNSWVLIWPGVIIAIGLAFLYRGLLKRK